MGILEATRSVNGLAGSIVDYGFIVVIAAVFILITLLMFMSMNKRYNMMFGNLINNSDKKHKELSTSMTALVQGMTSVLDIVKENQNGLAEKALHHQTYSGSLKIIKGHLNSTKLEIIRHSHKIIEKNHIENTEALEIKINALIKAIQKKRCIDMHEYIYVDKRLSTLIVSPAQQVFESTRRYIQDKHRNLDKFITELDAIYSDVINDVEAKMTGISE